ncbi:hypothetical protein GQ600_22059 [Phytophthora cactorum]|nr:hypothetical protein GQ600_22059 [Phytophthora cactorum]
MLMCPEEAAINVAATNQLLWIDRLLESFDGDLADAISNASANGHVDMIKRLLHKIEEREKQTLFALPFLREVALRKMYRATWQVLDEAATNGYLDVVNFAMDYATEWGYVELCAASGTGDALTRAIEGYHDDVATYLLGVCRIQWDLKSAYEKAIEGQRPELVERIYPLYSQYANLNEPQIPYELLKRIRRTKQRLTIESVTQRAQKLRKCRCFLTMTAP